MCLSLPFCFRSSFRCPAGFFCRPFFRFPAGLFFSSPFLCRFPDGHKFLHPGFFPGNFFGFLSLDGRHLFLHSHRPGRSLFCLLDFWFGFRHGLFGCGSSGLPSCISPFGHGCRAVGRHFCCLGFLGRLGLGSLGSLFPCLFFSLGFGFRPGFGPCFCPGLDFRFLLGLQAFFCFRFGPGLFLRLGLCLGIGFGLGLILGFFPGSDPSSQFGQASPGAFPGRNCRTSGFVSRVSWSWRLLRRSAAVVDGSCRYIAVRIHARSRKIDLDFSLAFIQHGTSMVDPNQTAVLIHIIGIWKGLELGRIHVIQVLEPVLGQSCQLVFGIIVAQWPQISGFPVKSHTEAFFNTHVGRHDQGETDQLPIRFVDIIVDLPSAQGGSFTGKRSRLAAQGPVDFFISCPAAAGYLRTFYRYFVFRTCKRLYSTTGICCPDRGWRGP